MKALSDMEERMTQFIQAKRMLEVEDHVLVAVSGGPDSVALLAVLQSLCPAWGLRLSVAHFNHGLRGAESEDDASFVHALCQTFDIPCIVTLLDLNAREIRRPGYSLQDYARERRYQELFRIATEIDADKVAVGHTANDQAETMVMWMVRGARTGGLGGIPPTRRPNVIRPLLETSREELLAYLDRKGLSYRNDSSNAKLIYLRNRIRKEVIPVLQVYNPNVVDALARQADIVREEHEYLDHLAEDALSHMLKEQSDTKIVLNRTLFSNVPVALRRRVIRKAIGRCSKGEANPGYRVVERVWRQIMHGQSGTSVISHGVSIIREYDSIRFSPVQRKLSFSFEKGGVAMSVSIPSEVVWSLTGQTLSLTLEKKSEDRSWAEDRNEVTLDAETFSASLTVRTWQPGDRFCPLGMGGKRKKIQDFFSDMKIQRAERHTIPLLVAPEGILWVGGYRLDNRFRVTESTKNILVVRMTEDQIVGNHEVRST